MAAGKGGSFCSRALPPSFVLGLLTAFGWAAVRTNQTPSISVFIIGFLISLISILAVDSALDRSRVTQTNAQFRNRLTFDSPFVEDYLQERFSRRSRVAREIRYRGQSSALEFDALLTARERALISELTSRRADIDSFFRDSQLDIDD